MTTNAAPPGWHPDPANPTSAIRWWDGAAWTDQTQPAPAAGSSYGQAGTPYGQPGMQYGQAATQYGHAGTPYGQPGAQATMSFARRNQLSLTAIGVVVLYVLLALTTRFVVFGILPVFMSIRATRRREPLAPVAIAAAVIAVIVAILALR